MRRSLSLDPMSLEVETFVAAALPPAEEPDAADPEEPDGSDWLTQVNCRTGRYWIDCL